MTQEILTDAQSEIIFNKQRRQQDQLASVAADRLLTPEQTLADTTAVLLTGQIHGPLLDLMLEKINRRFSQ